MGKVYKFTRQQLKSKNASVFKHGDLIKTGKYIIYILYKNGNRVYETSVFFSRVEDSHTFKILGCTMGTPGSYPYYIDDFLHR